MTATTEPRTARRRVTTAVLVLLVLAALGTFVWNAVETSTARVNATTESSALFSAGTVELAQPFTEVDLIFDASNLYPGNRLEGCVEIQYEGTISADVRLHARTLGGTGLEAFVDLYADAVDAESCDEPAPTGAGLHDGTLEELARTHPSYASGIRLGSWDFGETIVLRVAAELQDDNGAQGLTTDFSITVEARP